MIGRLHHFRRVFRLGAWRRAATRSRCLSALTLAGFVAGTVGVPIRQPSPDAAPRPSSIAAESASDDATDLFAAPLVKRLAASPASNRHDGNCCCGATLRAAGGCCCPLKSRAAAPTSSCCSSKPKGTTRSAIDRTAGAGDGTGATLASSGGAADETADDDTLRQPSIQCPCGAAPLELIHVCAEPRILTAPIELALPDGRDRSTPPGNDRATPVESDPAVPPPRALAA